MSEWVKVKDRLPEVGQEVLATFKGQFGWVMFTATSWPDGLVACGYAPPTHWHPLPECPEKN